MTSQTDHNTALISQADEALLDYGKLYQSQSSYSVAYPDSIEAVQRLITDNQTRPIRVRGSGHTFNGCTLPRAGELLLRTDHLDWYELGQKNTIVCGAGALVWDIKDLVDDYGYKLPVYNGGWAGPTLGGYLNAGGFGKGELSHEYGGLWENVLEVAFVDGLGTLQRVSRDDDEFPWLFGAYGQFGVVVELTLPIIPDHPLAALTFPKGETGQIPKRQAEDPKVNDARQGTVENILFWFSILITPEQEADAWIAMDAFCQRHSNVIEPDGGWAGPIRNGEPIGYHYDIRFHEFNPPLVYPHQREFIVMGIMTFLDVATDNDSILDIEKDFIALAEAGDFKLYLQAENIGRNVDYRQYYGDEVFEQFKTLKQRFDPKGLINSGLVFD